MKDRLRAVLFWLAHRQARAVAGRSCRRKKAGEKEIKGEATFLPARLLRPGLARALADSARLACARPRKKSALP